MSGESGEIPKDSFSFKWSPALIALVRSEAVIEDCSEEDIIGRAFSLYELAAQEMRSGGMLAVIRRQGHGRDEPIADGETPPQSVPTGDVRFDLLTWQGDGK